MSRFLIDFENTLQSVIEGQIFNQSSNIFPIKTIAHMISEAFQKELDLQKANPEKFDQSGSFILSIHPSKLGLWEKDPFILRIINHAFQQTASQAGFHFASQLSLSIEADAHLKLDELIIHAQRQEGLEKTSMVTIQNAENKQLPAFLIIEGRNVENITGLVTNLGRREGNDILINDPRVSRDHAQIRFVKDHYVIFDLHSTGGTFVNDQRIDQINLYAGDVISLAGFPIIFGQENELDFLSKGETLPMQPVY